MRYSFVLFFRSFRSLNSKKGFFGRTIYVSNHPASFLDPLVVATIQLPIVFFMTRADVFTKITKPFLWACHMLPIYRQQDGGDTKAKNDKIFNISSRILSNGRNLLIFGEGFTDDTFIRRLKPVKKGAAKIGFATLEKMNWKKKVYMVATGCNYTNPGKMRGGILVSNSDSICLNDWKELYLENPTKAITEVTKIIEERLREQITYVANKDDTPFHENMMMITRKGMNPSSYDPSLSLKSRWTYSRKLALWLNDQILEENEKLSSLKSDSEEYFNALKTIGVEDKYVFWKKSNGSRMKEILLLILLFPPMLLGFAHCFVPYIITKRFVEKSFKRDVFWSSVKLIMGKFFIGFVNIPSIFIFYYFIYPSWGYAILYFFFIGYLGLAAYLWFANLKEFKTKGKVDKIDLTEIIAKRDDLEARIKEELPAELA